MEPNDEKKKLNDQCNEFVLKRTKKKAHPGTTRIRSYVNKQIKEHPGDNKEITSKSHSSLRSVAADTSEGSFPSLHRRASSDSSDVDVDPFSIEPFLAAKLYPKTKCGRRKKRPRQHSSGRRRCCYRSRSRRRRQRKCCQQKHLRRRHRY